MLFDARDHGREHGRQTYSQAVFTGRDDGVINAHLARMTLYDASDRDRIHPSSRQNKTESSTLRLPGRAPDDNDDDDDDDDDDRATTRPVQACQTTLFLQQT